MLFRGGTKKSTNLFFLSTKSTKLTIKKVILSKACVSPNASLSEDTAQNQVARTPDLMLGEFWGGSCVCLCVFPALDPWYNLKVMTEGAASPLSISTT